jgi:hypothetical protein
MKITEKFLKILKENQNMLNICYIPFHHNYLLIIENKENQKRMFLILTQQQLKKMKKNNIKMIEDSFPKFPF